MSCGQFGTVGPSRFNWDIKECSYEQSGSAENANSSSGRIARPSGLQYNIKADRLGRPNVVTTFRPNWPWRYYQDPSASVTSELALGLRQGMKL